jgi:hypothetical protein
MRSISRYSLRQAGNDKAIANKTPGMSCGKVPECINPAMYIEGPIVQDKGRLTLKRSFIRLSSAILNLCGAVFETLNVNLDALVGVRFKGL